MRAVWESHPATTPPEMGAEAGWAGLAAKHQHSQPARLAAARPCLSKPAGQLCLGALSSAFQFSGEKTEADREDKTG